MPRPKNPLKRRRLSLDVQRQPPENDKSPLMEAPIEVRARILEFLFQGTRLCVTARSDYAPDHPKYLKYSASKATHRRCGIIWTCKALQTEAMPVLSRHALFELDLFAIGSQHFKDFKDTHFKAMQHLRVTDLSDISQFNSMCFPQLKCMHWNGNELDLDRWEWDDYVFEHAIYEPNVEELVEAVTGARAANIPRKWLDEIEAVAEGRRGTLNSKWQHGNYREARCLALLQRLINSKQRGFHMRATVYARFGLFHDVFTDKGRGSTGNGIVLMLKIEFDIDTLEILSRHLREVQWGSFWDVNDDDHIPATGPLPDININEDPTKYIKERLSETEIDLPNPFDYASDDTAGEASEAET